MWDLHLTCGKQGRGGHKTVVVCEELVGAATARQRCGHWGLAALHDAQVNFNIERDSQP
jgi:hypothetical protein